MELSESNVRKQTYESIALIPRPVLSKIPQPRSVSSGPHHNVTTPLRKQMEQKRRKNERTKKSSTYLIDQRKPQTKNTDWRIPDPAIDISYGTHITYNGHPIDLDPMVNRIQIILQNRRRMEDQRRMDGMWVEIQNGVYKSEIVEYPPDFLKNKLMKLLAIKDARENKHQH